MGHMTTITVKGPRRRPMTEREARAAWAAAIGQVTRARGALTEAERAAVEVIGELRKAGVTDLVAEAEHQLAAALP
jgi:hypothetical protein